MKKYVIALVMLFIFISPLSSFTQSQDVMEIKKIMQTQEQAWNAGDLESFMTGYWQNDSMMFIGKTGITYGWQSTLERYKQGYPDTTAMGKLHFKLLEINRLSPGYYFIVGKYHLKRTVGDAEGHFSLLFKKVNGQWLIVADHSS